jgi:hypothetical protein
MVDQRDVQKYINRERQPIVIMTCDGSCYHIKFTDCEDSKELMGFDKLEAEAIRNFIEHYVDVGVAPSQEKSGRLDMDHGLAALFG